MRAIFITVLYLHEGLITFKTQPIVKFSRQK